MNPSALGAFSNVAGGVNVTGGVCALISEEVASASSTVSVIAAMNVKCLKQVFMKVSEKIPIEI